jgi:hypothetical protein
VNNRKEILSSVAFLVVAAVYFLATYTIRISHAFAVTILTSASIPRILAAILFVLALIQLYVSKKTKAPAESEKAVTTDQTASAAGVDIKKQMQIAEKNESSSEYDNRNIVLTVIFLLVYLFAMTYIGFTIASFIYMVVQIMLMTKKTERKKKLLPAIVLSLVATICMYFLFNDLLGVLLPTGPFDF